MSDWCWGFVKKKGYVCARLIDMEVGRESGVARHAYSFSYSCVLWLELFI